MLQTYITNKENATLAQHGKIQLLFAITATPEVVAEGDRLFRSHAPWIESTHHRRATKLSSL